MTAATASRPRLLARPARRLPAKLAAFALIVALALGGGWLWLRDSGLVAVEDVFVVGLSSSDENRIRTAIKAAALDMTTLHIRRDQLDAAVAPFSSVEDLRVTADFPHKLTVEVVERHPVAVFEAQGRRVAVGAGGLIMRGLRADASLPTVRGRIAGAGGRLTDERALAAVAVLAAAPVPLRERTQYVFYGPRGMTLDLEDGPRVIFGTDRRAGAKWLAAARVLADRRAAGATYLDVRVPERVAAGGLAMATPAAVANAAATTAPVAPPATTETSPGNPQP